MATVSIHRAGFSGLSHDGGITRRKFLGVAASCTMKLDSEAAKKSTFEQLSLQIPAPAAILQPDLASSSKLRFDRLQPADSDLLEEDKVEFGQFVAREAMLDEELWTAAWLRAESNWENRPKERYVDSFKRKYADQEFHAVKRRCVGQLGQTCKCIVAVKKEDKNVKRTILKSVVGTLDLSIRYLMHGESFPGEHGKSDFRNVRRSSLNRYAYVSNLCVAKSARRQGIARNMLSFAIESAKSNGVGLIYVHVDRNNEPAKQLYDQMGFEMVEAASSLLLVEQTYLLCLKA